MNTLYLTSPDYKHNAVIPKDYTCHGKENRPTFSFSGMSTEAQSMVLIMHDPDAVGGEFVHWLVWSIPPGTTGIKGGEATPGVEGYNSRDRKGYTPPCPPDGTHRYITTLYTLTKMLDYESTYKVKRQHILDAMKGYIIQEAVLEGIYGQ